MPDEILEGDALREWVDRAPTARCDSCERATWEEDAVGLACGMPQPDGSTCPGRFRGPPEDA